MPPRYFLRCLGTPELRGPTGEPIRIRTRKHLALLIYLAVEPRHPHRRDRLADLLWPDASAAESRHSLATALSVIRGKLGPRSYESTRDTVKLVTPDLEIDLDRLIRGEVLGDEYTPPLEMGAFLSTFDIPNAPEFMHWCDQMRAQLFPTIRSGFVTLMDRRRRTGAFAAIEPLADRLLEIDPLNEDAIRAKMEGRAFAGDRISALRVYNDWKNNLLKDLGAVPSALVDGMAVRLRKRGYEAPEMANAPTVQTDQWKGRAFIGRGSEYNNIYGCWESTKNGRGQHVLLLGESGIGKTTLLERFLTASGLEGAMSVRVQCYEAEREIPFSAVSALVRGLVACPGSSATEPEWLAELASTVPEVAQKFPTLPKVRDTQGETARLRLAEAVHQLVNSVSEEMPIILVVDDIHLSDDASIAVLHLLMRRTQNARVMVALSARPHELSKSPSACRISQSAPALALAVCDIPPLSEQEVDQLIEALAGESAIQVPLAVQRSLAQAGAGLPMVLELLFDDWRHNGQNCLALSVKAMTVEAGEKGRNELVDQIFERVIRGLSEVARSVLSLGAILGERLNDLSMYDLVDLSLAQRLNGMTELVESRVLRDGGKGLEFRNELLRNRAYYAVPPSLRKSYHGLIADRLMLSNKAGELVPGLTLAWHCFRAGRPQQATQFLLAGANEALKKGAHFEVQLALTSALGSLTGEEVTDAQILLSECFQAQGRWANSIEILEEARPHSAYQLEQIEVLRLYGRCFLIKDQVEASERLSEIRLNSSRFSISARTKLLFAVQRLINFLGDPVEAGTEMVAARELLPQLKSLPDRVAGYTAFTGISWLAPRANWSNSIQSLEGLAEECREFGLLDSNFAQLLRFQGCAYMAIGRYTKAIECHQAAIHLAHLHGDSVREADSADNISLCCGRLGRYHEQKQWADRALKLYPTNSDPWWFIRSSFRSAYSLCMLGENRKGRDAVVALLANRPAPAPLWVDQAIGLIGSDILLLCGENEQAYQLARLTFEKVGYTWLTRGYSGPLARWSSKLFVEDSNTAAGDLLQLLFGSLPDHDLMDQAEILTAKIVVGNREGRDCREERLLLEERLSDLPPAAAHHLKRLQQIA